MKNAIHLGAFFAVMAGSILASKYFPDYGWMLGWYGAVACYLCIPRKTRMKL